MKSIFSLLILTLLCLGCSKVEPEKPVIMPSPYIFHSENHKNNTDDFSVIYQVMGKYYEGVEKANIDLLAEVFHSTWFMRDTDMPNEAALNVEDKQAFMNRVDNHGPYPGYAKNRVFANVAMVYDQLAFVRINKDPSRNSTSFFLYKIKGKWTIMDKVWVNTRETHTVITPSRKSFSTIESMIQNYFEALATSDLTTLDTLLQEAWDLKYIDKEGFLQIISKSQLLNTLKEKTAFTDFSQLLSIEIYHDKLAIVRIDQPYKATTSFITLFKIDEKWLIASERKSQNHLPLLEEG